MAVRLINGRPNKNDHALKRRPPGTTSPHPDKWPKIMARKRSTDSPRQRPMRHREDSARPARATAPLPVQSSHAFWITRHSLPFTITQVSRRESGIRQLGRSARTGSTSFEADPHGFLSSTDSPPLFDQDLSSRSRLPLALTQLPGRSTASAPTLATNQAYPRHVARPDKPGTNIPNLSSLIFHAYFVPQLWNSILGTGCPAERLRAPALQPRHHGTASSAR
jgi:hypothetical protein